MKKLTIITGAGSGLGAEFARQLFYKYERDNLKNIEFEREIWIIARSTDNLKKVSDELKGKTKIQYFSINLAGISGAEKFKELLDKQESEEFFLIETLINNAGFGTYGPFEETEPEKEMEMIDLNCTALTGICGYSLKYMKKDSKIINVSSLAAFMPLGNFAVYAATKSYVLSFSIALAAELKDKGISVSALCAGSVSTNFANVASNGKRKKVLHGKDPIKVVKHCLRKAEKKEIIVQTFFKWKVTAFLSRFVGRYLVARYTYKYAKRPH